MDLLLTVGVPVAVFAVLAVIYLVFPRVKGLHFTSRLNCPKCSKQFDFNWVPLGSFSSVRLGSERYLSCPNCHKWSTFEIWNTRIKKDKQAAIDSKPNVSLETAGQV
jgi:RNA polymerase subunit RPABC4/transcription elongation factor Spt4